MRWIYDRRTGTNEASGIVGNYFEKIMLAKMGYTFSTDDLSSFDVDCFNIIESTINECQRKKH